MAEKTRLFNNHDGYKMWLPLCKAKLDNEDAHKFTAVISTNKVDRDKEVLLPRGADLSEFKQVGMPIFWNHNYDLPVAKGTSIKQDDDSIPVSGEFARRPEGFEGPFYPDTYRALVNQQIVRGVSVGFDPIVERAATKKDKLEFGEDVKRVFERWKLTEFSFAPVQSNIEAVTTGVQKGIITKDNYKMLCEDIKQAEELLKMNQRKKVYVYIPSAKPKPKARPKPVKTVKQIMIEAKDEAIADLRGELYL